MPKTLNFAKVARVDAIESMTPPSCALEATHSSQLIFVAQKFKIKYCATLRITYQTSGYNYSNAARVLV